MTGAPTARSLIVIAKEPEPGRVKTRLHAEFSPDEAADLAAAALRDTLRAAAACRVPTRVLCWVGGAGSADGRAPGFTLIPQRGGGLDQRLAGAFADVWRDGPHPALLIGMDTPQVAPADLEVDWGDADAVLGLAPDGGFWAIGLRTGDPGQIFGGVPMSTAQTGAAQLARLHDLGLEVRLLPPRRDVDTPADAAYVAAEFPHLEFSRRYRTLLADRRAPGPAAFFDRAYGADGASVSSADGDDPLGLDVSRWRADADEVDALLVARCRPPVLDIGCGPGRLLVVLSEAGLPALGVDVSAAAVEASRARGVQVLRRDLSDALPLEGRWGSVVLLDSNLGIGGDVSALLRRCRHLVASGGTILCEVDVDPGAAGRQLVELTTGAGTVTLPWARAGSARVVALATELDLEVAEEWSAGGRSFVSLRKP